MLQVTILINNAGVGRRFKFLDVTDKLLKRTIDVNVMSHFWVYFKPVTFNSYSLFGNFDKEKRKAKNRFHDKRYNTEVYFYIIDLRIFQIEQLLLNFTFIGSNSKTFLSQCKFQVRYILGIPFIIVVISGYW